MDEENGSSTVETAANLPGEYELLGAVVADLRDDFPKSVYADWLEERGDRRAAFVREFVAATQSLDKSTKLPDASKFPRAWVNMLGVPLIEGLIEFDLLDVKDAVLRVARPIVTIGTERLDEDAIPTGGSKFGGLPDLPRDVEWPTCEEGPLGFLGQIDLREVARTQAARALPSDGLLSFFAFGDHVGAYDFGGDARVLYTPPARALVRRQPPGSGSNSFRPFAPCRLSMRETWDLPDCEDLVPPELAPSMSQLNRLRDDSRGGSFYDLRRKCHPFGHHLMGYSVHLRTSDPSPGADWTHLLCLDSDDNLGWNWCDDEHLAIWVHEEDLQIRAFQRVYGYAS